MSTTKYNSRKPEALAEMERLSLESITNNPKIPPRRKASCRDVMRALYGRARRDGTCVVPGGERSLLEATSIRRRETIRETLRLLVEAEEITNITPGEPGSAQRRAHYAAGKQSEYRLRDRRSKGRKAATEQSSATVETGHASQVLAGLGTVETGPSTTNVVRLGYSPPPHGGGSYLIEKDHLSDGGGSGIGASATRTNSPVAAQLRSDSGLRSAVPDQGHALAPFGRSLTDVAASSSAADQSPVTASLPHRVPPPGADRALVFRYDLSPMCLEIYLLLTGNPAKVNHLAITLNTAWSNVNGCLRKLAALGLASRTDAGLWVLGDADPFTAHSAKAEAKAAAVRNENRQHHERQEFIRAEYMAAAEVQPVEVVAPVPTNEDNAPVVSDASSKCCEHGPMVIVKSSTIKKTGKLWQVLGCPQDVCDRQEWLSWEVGQEPPAGWIPDTPEPASYDKRVTKEREPIADPAFERLVAGTRCRECGGKMPASEVHIGIHFACEFPEREDMAA